MNSHRMIILQMKIKNFKNIKNNKRNNLKILRFGVLKLKNYILSKSYSFDFKLIIKFKNDENSEIK